SKVAIEAYAHQDLPFERLVEALQPERGLNRPPVFQVTFNFQHSTLADIDLRSLQIDPLDIAIGTSKYDLTVYLWEDRDKLEGALAYNTDLFEADTIDRMCRRFTTLLSHALARPEVRISRLEMLTEDERRRLV